MASIILLQDSKTIHKGLGEAEAGGEEEVSTLKRSKPHPVSNTSSPLMNTKEEVQAEAQEGEAINKSQITNRLISRKRQGIVVAISKLMRMMMMTTAMK